MPFTVESSAGAGFGLLFVIGLLWGIFVAAFYMVVAWRAMRAHERLAKVVTYYVDLKYRDASAPVEGRSIMQDDEGR